MKTNILAKPIFIVTGVIIPIFAQAEDIKPMHSVCWSGNAINWPKPVGAGSPTGIGTSLNPAHGGSGALGNISPYSATAADIIRFTCPQGISGSFEVNIRDKGNMTSAINDPQHIRVTHLPPGVILPNSAGYYFAQDNWGGNGYWNQYPSSFDGGATIENGASYDIRIQKINGLPGIVNARRYELCVRCYQLPNEGGIPVQPIAASYLQNQ